MEEKIITAEDLAAFRQYLIKKEAGKETVEKYLRCAGNLKNWLSGRALSKELAIEWKENLRRKGLAPATVNGYIAAANALFLCLGAEIRIRALKIQRKIFTDKNRELTKEEYERLISAAMDKGNVRLALLFETICATGIRVSEVRYITLEAAASGRADISLKGKIRTILIPHDLCRKLRKYAKKNGIKAGEIFLSKTGRPLSRKQIWADMKSVCEEAHVEPEKVFPHNLRHLFARTFYRITKDVVKLADVLGHSNISTTRIYLISTEKEHRSALERLKLVC